MSIALAIEHLNDYAKDLNDDEDFKEFSQTLNVFMQKNKDKINLNDKESFINALKSQILKNYNEDNKDYKDFFFIQASALALEMESNNFINYDKYYANFQKAYDELREKERLKELEEEREKFFKELSQSLELNKELSKERIELKEQIASYEKALEVDDFINPNQDEKNIENSQNISPRELISFIKDEKQIYYPFDRKSTLLNPSFMKDFKKELHHLSNKELEEMIMQVRAKNEALKQELKLLKDKKESLFKELNKEMIDNANLSLKKDLKEESENSISNENSNNDELFEKIAQAQAEADKWAKDRKENTNHTNLEGKEELSDELLEKAKNTFKRKK